MHAAFLQGTSNPDPLLLWLQAPEASRRQGVCIGLAEVLENITRQQLQEHLSELLPAVQSALCDPDAGVRQVGTASGLPLPGLGQQVAHTLLDWLHLRLCC